MSLSPRKHTNTKSSGWCPMAPPRGVAAQAAHRPRHHQGLFGLLGAKRRGRRAEAGGAPAESCEESKEKDLGAQGNVDGLSFQCLMFFCAGLCVRLDLFCPCLVFWTMTLSKSYSQKPQQEGPQSSGMKIRTFCNINHIGDF